MLELRVEDAQATLMFEQARLSNYAGVPFAGLVCWLLWHTVDHAALLTWFGLKVAVTAARAGVEWRWRHATVGGARSWAHVYTALLAVDGAVFGLIGTWLLPRDDPGMAAMMLASVVGVAAVGFVVLSANLRASVALLLPLLGPNIVWQLGENTRLGSYTALAFLLFVGLIIYEGRRASAYSRAMHKLRFQMDHLAEQREQALWLAERNSSIKSRFLATMSHEMRTPLNGLLGMLQVLRREARESQAEAYELMERSGAHLLRIINDVLDLSKIEAGRIELGSEPFDLAGVVDDAARIFGSLCEQKGIALTLQSDLGASHWVLGDGARVRQVLDNLLGNACKFTTAGCVTLHAHRDGERVVFRIEDSGIGIAPEELPLLFSPFHQADSSYARRHGGTGLGLVIARQLAREMRGDVRCERTGPQGSEFVFEAALPLCNVPIATPASESEAGPALRGRVLLVEDNAVNVIVATALLEQLGLQVESVGDGEAAIARCREHPPDLVLMDCQMPSVDGFEATRRIRQSEARAGAGRLPIIALTANALPCDRARCLAAGMDDHLPKPVQQDELRRVLARWLR